MLFYWLAWMYWVMIVFFMQPTKRHSRLSIWVLLLISCSHVYINIASYDVSLSFIILMIGSMGMHARLPASLYHLFCALTFSIAFMGILLWEELMPIWMFMPKLVMVPMILIVILIAMTKAMYNKLWIGLLGLSHGELLYKLILAEYRVPTTIGSPEFFDYAVVITCLIMTWHLFKTVKQYVANMSKLLVR